MSMASKTAVTAACAAFATLAVWAASAAPESGAGARTQDAVFVSYTPGEKFGALTVQQGSVLRAFVLAQNAVVQERVNDGQPSAISAAELQSGEPLTLHLAPNGTITQIDARYQLVYARFIAASNGSVITTSGAAYKLVGGAASSAAALELGTYLRLKVNAHDNTAFDLAASKQPFAGAPAGAQVSVTFIVTVPANTPPSDIVYITADAQNWVPNAIRMAPLAAHRWTATLTLGQGSSLKYKYTRGSWPTVESNQAGIQIPNRSLVVTKSGATQTVNDIVIRWSDLPS
jgi:hypothetical protein